LEFIDELLICPPDIIASLSREYPDDRHAIEVRGWRYRAKLLNLILMNLSFPVELEAPSSSEPRDDIVTIADNQPGMGGEFPR
jgi:hypothetical protein